MMLHAPQAGADDGANGRSAPGRADGTDADAAYHCCAGTAVNISTSTFLLPRHESLFELPVNTTESLEARRAKVLAKLNTRGTTTVEAIREMVSIVTGCDGAVVEHFSQYAFTVIVYMLFEGVFPDLSELIRQIDEIKPAHLTFDIVGAFRPIGIENKVEVSLYRLKIRSRFANTRGQRVVRFDGEADFDGSILFNQSFSGITSRPCLFAPASLSGKNQWHLDHG